MTLTVYETLEQGTDEWLEARRGLVTASTMNRLVTPTLKTADNDTSRALLNTLACERITGHVEPHFETFDMARGHNEEPWAREEYAAHQGVEVAQIGFMTREFNGATLGYSPDGLVNDDGLIEIKCPNTATHIDTILTGAVPDKYLKQMLFQMACTGRDWCDFVSFDPRMPDEMQLFIKRVPRDDEAIAEIEAAVLAILAEADELIAKLTAKFAGKEAA